MPGKKPAARAARRAHIRRSTRETRIELSLALEGRGRAQVSTGVRFLDHMLELVAMHGGFDLELRAQGDLDVDQHHTVEDTGLALGAAFARALGDKRGIRRAGYFLMPMDEALALAAVDFSGRPKAVLRLPLRVRRVGDLDAELLEDFFEAFAMAARANLHVRTVAGRNSHHKVEAAFKAFARALRSACERDARLRGRLPSTKGLL